jgi:hypothetical protein
MWPRDGTDHIADRTTRNVWIDTRASGHEPRIMRVCDDGARRTRTADLLGAIQALSQLSYSPEEREV